MSLVRTCVSWISMIPFILVLGILATDWYTFNFIWFAHSFEKEKIGTVFACLLFNVLMCLTLVSYVKTCFTSSAVIDNPAPSNFSELIERGMPTCGKCNSAKPVRSHHCSVCEKCV